MNFTIPLSRPLFLALVAATLAACGGDAPPPSSDPAPAVGAEAEKPVVMAAEQRREAGVEVAPAGAQTLAEALTVYGEIRPAAERIRHVSARYPGIARKVLKNVGDAVAAGETLLIVESNDSLEPYRITAPIAGRVLDRQVNEGEALGPQALFTIGDLSRVWAELEVFPQDAGRVRGGQAVDVIAARGALRQRAPIDYVAASAASAQRSVTVRATLDNADGRWRPGQFVQGEIVLAERPVALAVPQAALQQIDGKPTVFVETGSGFVPRALVIGAQDRQYAEVREGLSAGERIVVANSFLLKSQWLAQGE